MWLSKIKEAGLSLTVIIGGYLFALLVAGLLTPWVYEMLSGHIGQSFDRYVDRLRWVGVLALLPLWWRVAQIQKAETLGWSHRYNGLVLFILGAISVMVVSLTTSVLFESGYVGSSSDITWNFLKWLPALKVLAAAFFLSVVEEFVFRGILQRIWVRGFGQTLGIWLGAIFFAWLHGRPAMDWVSPHLGLSDSLQLAWSYVSAMPSNVTAVQLINLTLLGGVLGIVYAKSRTLWLPIGLHAGIVAMLGWTGPFAAWMGVRLPPEPLVELPAATILLALWVAVVSFWPSRQADEESDV